MRLLTAIPVFNEHKYLNHVLDQVRRYTSDILVIDDGSTDGTADVLAGRGDVRVIRHARNMGYGQSLIDAFDFADRHSYDWVITMDCDEQHEPSMIPEFRRQIELDDADVVSGSRYMIARGDDDLPPADRRLVNQTITALLNKLFPQLRLTDAFCGYKAHRVSAMRRLRLTETGYAFPLQLWPQIVRYGLTVKEIPVRLIYNDPTRHFGGKLDDTAFRLKHYLKVLDDEMQAWRAVESSGKSSVCAVCA